MPLKWLQDCLMLRKFSFFCCFFLLSLVWQHWRRGGWVSCREVAYPDSEFYQNKLIWLCRSNVITALFPAQFQFPLFSYLDEVCRPALIGCLMWFVADSSLPLLRFYLPILFLLFFKYDYFLLILIFFFTLFHTLWLGKVKFSASCVLPYVIWHPEN